MFGPNSLAGLPGLRFQRCNLFYLIVQHRLMEGFRLFFKFHAQLPGIEITLSLVNSVAYLRAARISSSVRDG